MNSKPVVILWGPFGFRADELAEAVGADRVSITLLYGPRYFAPIRYLALFFKTLFILFSRRPSVVYAQNPPVFCPLTCLLYCNFMGTKLVIDHHSIWQVKTLGRGPLSKIIGMLERFVSRAADGNTAPHKFWADSLSAMGARNVLVVHDFVERNPYPRDEALRESFASEPIIAISSHGGHPLERMESEAAAAGMVGPSLALLITGPKAKLEGRLSAAALPSNVRYLGFLERGKYEKLKASADFALNITDEPYTLSHVLLEFMASSLPIISTRQEVLEDFFGGSLLYTDSSPAHVAEKIKLFLDPSIRKEYRERVDRRFEEMQSAREAELTQLRALISL